MPTARTPPSARRLRRLCLRRLALALARGRLALGGSLIAASATLLKDPIVQRLHLQVLTTQKPFSSSLRTWKVRAHQCQIGPGGAKAGHDSARVAPLGELPLRAHPCGQRAVRCPSKPPGSRQAHSRRGGFRMWRECQLQVCATAVHAACRARDAGSDPRQRSRRVVVALPSRLACRKLVQSCVFRIRQPRC